MSQTCKTCRHERVDRIDVQLASGTSLRSIAVQTGLSKASLGRHATKCLLAKLAKASALAEKAAGTSEGSSGEKTSRETEEPLVALVLGRIASAEELLAIVKASLVGCARLMARAERDGRDGDYLKGAKELREGLGLIGKVQGLIHDGAAYVDQSKHLHLRVSKMTDAEIDSALNRLLADATDNGVYPPIGAGLEPITIDQDGVAPEAPPVTQHPRGVNP